MGPPDREQKPKEQSTEHLMLRFQRTGDAEAFEKVVTRCLPSAMAVAQQVLSDTSSAEDAVQEAFLRVVRGREAYAPSRPFSSWFFAILRNICVDILRSRARRTKLVQEAAARRSAVQRPADSPAGALDLLAGLPKGQRDVLVLRIVHELSFREVGAALGLTEEAAKKRAQRGLRRLRRMPHVREAFGVAVVEAGVPG